MNLGYNVNYSLQNISTKKVAVYQLILLSLFKKNILYQSIDAQFIVHLQLCNTMRTTNHVQGNVIHKAQ
jgi:hypothetical protein